MDLPGNWYASCDWEPYEIYITVDDGRVRLGRLEDKTPVATDGRFRIDYSSGPAGMIGGVMAGNGKVIQVFSGSLAGENPRGKYRQYNTAIGTYTCGAKIRFRRDSNSAV